MYIETRGDVSETKKRMLKDIGSGQQPQIVKNSYVNYWIQPLQGSFNFVFENPVIKE